METERIDDRPLRRSHRQCRQQAVRLNLHVPAPCLRNGRSAGERTRARRASGLLPGDRVQRWTPLTPLNVPADARSRADEQAERARRLRIPRREACAGCFEAMVLGYSADVDDRGLLSPGNTMDHRPDPPPVKGTRARVDASNLALSAATTVLAEDTRDDKGAVKQACGDRSPGSLAALRLTAAHPVTGVEAHLQDSMAREQGEPRDIARGDERKRLASLRSSLLAQGRLPVQIQGKVNARAWSSPRAIRGVQVDVERMPEGITLTIRWPGWRVSVTNQPAASLKLRLLLVRKGGARQHLREAQSATMDAPANRRSPAADVPGNRSDNHPGSRHAGSACSCRKPQALSTRRETKGENMRTVHYLSLDAWLMVEFNRSRGDQDCPAEQDGRRAQARDASWRKESLQVRHLPAASAGDVSHCSRCCGQTGGLLPDEPGDALASHEIQASRQARKRRGQECDHPHGQQAIGEMPTSRVNAGYGEVVVEILQGIAAGESPVFRSFAVWKGKSGREGFSSAGSAKMGALFCTYAQAHWKTGCIHRVTPWLVHTMKRRSRPGAASQRTEIVFYAFLRSCIECLLHLPGGRHPGFTRRPCEGDYDEQTD